MSDKSALQAAATAYADSLVEYHEVRLHVESAGGPDKCLRGDASALRNARDAMYYAQNVLNEVAEELAKQS